MIKAEGAEQASCSKAKPKNLQSQNPALGKAEHFPVVNKMSKAKDGKRLLKAPPLVCVPIAAEEGDVRVNQNIA